MKKIVGLPFSKSFQIAYQSIRVRFFRSLVTTMSLVLAISFLTFTYSTNDIAEGLLTSKDPVMIQKLIKAGFDFNPGDSSVGSSAKQRWIVILSLLVCVVGIVNAQLMSVTERFREIGTLKCLGALDRFVVRIFVIEASIQGLAGSFGGTLVGILTAILAGLLKYGSAVLSHLSFYQLVETSVLGMMTGTILSLLGVLYPAIVASKMQPVEAMRVEQ